MARILIEYYDPEHINTIMSLLHRQYDSVFILYVQRGGGPSEEGSPPLPGPLPFSPRLFGQG